MPGRFDGTVHMAHFDLQGGALCPDYNGLARITMDYFKADCVECKRIYRDETQLSQNLTAEEKDINRIMFEQNCSRSTAEYVHEVGAKLKARTKARIKAKQNQ